MTCKSAHHVWFPDLIPWPILLTCLVDVINIYQHAEGAQRAAKTQRHRQDKRIGQGIISGNQTGVQKSTMHQICLQIDSRHNASVPDLEESENFATASMRKTAHTTEIELVLPSRGWAPIWERKQTSLRPVGPGHSDVDLAAHICRTQCVHERQSPYPWNASAYRRCRRYDYYVERLLGSFVRVCWL